MLVYGQLNFLDKSILKIKYTNYDNIVESLNLGISHIATFKINNSILIARNQIM